jgi:DNA-binding CsgD family transcriptional regulator/tetratricopeptide (TPR) repeat protein
MGAVGLLGRDGELREVMDAIARAAPLVLVTGDAGIGKSRLVAQAVEDSRAAGVVALVGGCVPLAGKLPLLPFVEALGGMDEAVAAAQAGRVPDSLRPALAPLMPAQAIAADGAWEEHGAWERERLVLAIAALFSPPARTRPMVVVIEDVHWADSFTLDVLSFLVGGTSTGVTLVVTLRTDHQPMPEDVSSAVRELQRLDDTVTVELGPLPGTVVALQAEEILGLVPSAAWVQELIRLGGGNPFFTEQLCRTAGPFNSSAAGGLFVLPPRLSGFLQARVRGLTEQARRAVLVLGVAAIPLSAEELANAADLTAGAAADAVRELSRANLLAPAERARFMARHALVAAAVAEVTNPITLAEAHARVASLMEERGDPALAGAAAGHWSAAGRDLEELRASIVAARVAQGLSDYAAAAALWMRAYALAKASPEAAAEHGESLVGLAVWAVQALQWSGQTVGGAEFVEAAYSQLAPVEETALGGSLRRWVGHFRAIRDRAAGADMMREAQRVLSEHPPSADLSACLQLLGRIAGIEGRYEESRSLLGQATAVARQCHSLSDEAQCVVSLAIALLDLRLPDQALTEIAALAPRLQTSGNARAQGIVAIFESDLLLQTGRLHQARTVASSALAVMTREGLGGMFEASILRYNAGEAELELGHTSAVLELTAPFTTALAPQIDSTGTHLLRSLADLNRGLMQQALGRILGVREESRRQSSPEAQRVAAQAVTKILLWSRQPSAAIDAITGDLELLAGTDQQTRCSELFTLGAAAAADLIATARAQHDVDGQARGQQTLEWLNGAIADSPHDPFEPVLVGGREPADRLQWDAELSRAAGASDVGLWNAAAVEWESQLRAHRAAYCWWRLAQAHVDHGGRTPEFTSALQRAYELSEEMVPQATAVKELAERANIRLTTRPETQEVAAVQLPVALTARERQILWHVVAGRTNAQIGQDLFISDKTVSVHVTHLLRKIGVRSRVQAAAWAEHVGFTDRPDQNG